MQLKSNYPLSIYVKFELGSAFIDKVSQQTGCKIVNVTEVVANELLEYQVQCPKEKEDLIIDYGFMTFISNPAFQKYYTDHPVFKLVAQGRQAMVPSLRSPQNPTPNL